MHGLEWAALCYKQPSEIANCSISTDATDGITPYNYLKMCIRDSRWAAWRRCSGSWVAGILAIFFPQTLYSSYGLGAKVSWG